MAPSSAYVRRSIGIDARPACFVRGIMPDAENLRHRANLLLVAAQRARDDDCAKLAENISDRATQLFGEAIILERRSAARAA
jgi:hypothetical protein